MYCINGCCGFENASSRNDGMVVPDVYPPESRDGSGSVEESNQATFISFSLNSILVKDYEPDVQK